MSVNGLTVIGAAEVGSALKGREKLVLEAVQRAYETHARGASSLAHSSFLPHEKIMKHCKYWPTT